MRIPRSSLGIGAGVLVAVALVGVRTTTSFLKTSHRVVSEEVSDHVPVPFQVERLKQMVEDLAPEIQDNRLRMAEAEVDVDKLQEEVSELGGILERKRGQLIAQRDMLASSDVQFVVGGRRYKRDQLEADLGRKLDEFEAQQQLYEDRKKLLEARQQVAISAREKLNSYQREQQRLDVQVAQLESQLQQIEAMEGAHELEFNYNQLAEARRLRDYLKRKLDVAQRMLEDSSIANDGIPGKEFERRDILAEVDEKLGLGESETEIVTFDASLAIVE